MNKNYAILTMHIPLEIQESGKYKLHKDRMDIDMKRCEELPAKKKQNYDSVMEVLSQMFDSTDKKEVIKEKIKWEKTESDSGASSSSSESGQDSDSDSGEEEDYELESTIDYNNNDMEEEEEGEKKEETSKIEQPKEKEPEVEQEVEPELRVYSHEIKKGKNPSHLISFKKRDKIKDKNSFTRKLHV